MLLKELLVAQVVKNYSTLYATETSLPCTHPWAQMNIVRTSHHLSFGSIIMPFYITHNWVTVKVVSRIFKVLLDESKPSSHVIILDRETGGHFLPAEFPTTVRSCFRHGLVAIRLASYRSGGFTPLSKTFILSVVGL